MSSLKQRNVTTFANISEKEESSVNLKAQTGKTWGRDRGKYNLKSSSE